MPFEKNENEIGALWERTSRNGVPFLSGKINGQDVVCFRNKNKGEKAPTWNVMKSQPRPDGDAPARAPHNANRTPLDDF